MEQSLLAGAAANPAAAADNQRAAGAGERLARADDGGVQSGGAGRAPPLASLAYLPAVVVAASEPAVWYPARAGLACT